VDEGFLNLNQAINDANELAKTLSGLETPTLPDNTGLVSINNEVAPDENEEKDEINDPQIYEQILGIENRLRKLEGDSQISPILQSSERLDMNTIKTTLNNIQYQLEGGDTEVNINNELKLKISSLYSSFQVGR